MVKLSEKLRKSIHLSSLLIPFSYKYILGFSHRRLAFALLLAAFVVSLTIEFYRLWQRSFGHTFYRLFGMILRRHELRDFTGATYLLFSSMLCVAFFEPLIAFCAIAYLSIGDTAAALVGMSWGKRKFLGMSKSLEGSLGCFLITLIFGMIFLNHPILAVVGALAATTAELWKIPVDDNVKIPLSSGIALTLASILI